MLKILINNQIILLKLKGLLILKNLIMNFNLIIQQFRRILYLIIISNKTMNIKKKKNKKNNRKKKWVKLKLKLYRVSKISIKLLNIHFNLKDVPIQSILIIILIIKLHKFPIILYLNSMIMKFQFLISIKKFNKKLIKIKHKKTF